MDKDYSDINMMFGYMSQNDGETMITDIKFKNAKEMKCFISICINNGIEFGIVSYRELDNAYKEYKKERNGLDQVIQEDTE